MSAQTETAAWNIRTEVDPHLTAMAAVYDLSVDIDTEAVNQALPHLQLPGTKPGPLGVKLALIRGDFFKDVYDTNRISYGDEDIEGSEVCVYYSQGDVRNRRNHQEVILPAIREAINLRNRSLRKAVRRYTNLRGYQALTNSLICVGVPTAAALLGAHELGDAAHLGTDATETLEVVGSVGAFVTSGLATIRYGITLGQKSELRRSPYQKQGQPIPEDLPPIVQFKRLDRTA